MGKTLTVDMTGTSQPRASYNMKGVTTLVIQTQGSKDFLDGIKSVVASGGTFAVTINTEETQYQDFTVKFTNIADPEKLIVKAYGLEGQTYYYEHTASYFYNEDKFKDARESKYWDTENGITKVTGSVFDDVIKFSDSTNGLNINSGAGNDTITGTTGNDTITGGTGENVINYSDGKDTVNLTGGEKLTLDLTGKTFSYTIGGKKNADLIVSIDDNNSIALTNFAKSNIVGAKGWVKLTDSSGTTDLNDSTIFQFDEENLKGNKKKRTAAISGTRLGDEISIDASTFDADDVNGIQFTEKEEDNGKTFEAYELKYTINAGEGKNDITLKNAYNTNTITAGSGNDIISISDTYYYDPDADDDDFKGFKNAKTTVKAGNGNNEIYVDGSGNNILIAGNGDDKFYFGDKGSSNAMTTVKAGKGENYIYIKDTDFGNVTLAEEKVAATNNIGLGGFNNYKFQKIGKSNDLIITNDSETSKLTVKDFFVTGKKNATNLIGEENTGDYDYKKFEDLLKDSVIDYTVTGEGVIKGSNYSEKIIGSEKTDKIYSGKGDDTINGGDGTNYIYINKGDGADTIEQSSGTDILIFGKGSNVKMGFVDTESTDTNGDIYDLHIYYNNKDKSDYALIEGCIRYTETDGKGTYKFLSNETSVKTIKIGSKSYSLESLLDRNKIENVLTTDKKTGELSVVGTAKHDDIYLTDSEIFKDGKEVTVYGGDGTDNIMIGSNIELSENVYNIDPASYNKINIAPTVYTYNKASKGVVSQDKSLGTYDKVVSYASQNGTYYAQSAISDIKVYGDGTDDNYHTYYNNQFTKLYDESGNDTLYIEDKKSTDLKLIFTVSKDYKNWSTTDTSEYFDTDGKVYNDNKDDLVNLIGKSLQEVKLVTSDDREYFLLNPYENNDIGIDIDYWGDKGLNVDDDPTEGKAKNMLALDKNTLTKFGGGIETIVASDGKYITSADIAQVASEVAKWLNGDGHEFGEFDNVEAVLGSGNTDALNAIIAKFDTIEWKAMPVT